MVHSIKTLPTEEQIKQLRNKYANKRGLTELGVDIPIDFGDSDITSEGPPSKIPGTVSDILDQTSQVAEMFRSFDNKPNGINNPIVFNRDLLIPSVSILDITIPDLIPLLSDLRLHFLRNSINKGSNGKFLLKFVDDATKHIYYWDGEKTKDGKITLQNIFKHKGKQFYKKYPHPAIIKGIIY